MNLVPSGTISDVDGGARLIGPRRPSPEKPFMPSNGAGRLRRGGAEEPASGCRLSLSSTTWAFTSMVGGSSLATGVWASLRDVGPGALSPEACAAGARWPRPVGRRVSGGWLRELRPDSASHHLVLSARAALTAGVACKAPEHRDRGDGGAGELGRDVLGDGRQAEHIDMQHLAGAPRRFEILAAVIPQPEVQSSSGPSTA